MHVVIAYGLAVSSRLLPWDWASQRLIGALDKMKPPDASLRSDT